MRVLVACEFSGVVREAFAEKGHESWSCDLEPTDIPGNHFQGDIREVLDGTWDLIIAHPPCTYLTVSGNRWFGEKYRERWPNRFQDREDAVRFFMLFPESAPQVAIENPVGIMSTRWRKPDQVIHPFQFGHSFSKATCYWLENLPKLISTQIVEPEWVRFESGKRMSVEHYRLSNLPPIRRSRERSRTPLGIAKAMADQWG